MRCPLAKIPGHCLAVMYCWSNFAVLFHEIMKRLAGHYDLINSVVFTCLQFEERVIVFKKKLLACYWRVSSA